MVWRSTCGVTCLPRRDGQVWRARATCLSSKSSTLSGLSRPPWAVGNSVSVQCLLGSASQVFSTPAVIFVSGVHLSFRPFPTHRTWAPTPSCTSLRCSPVNSDKRNPVCTATSNKRCRRGVRTKFFGSGRPTTLGFQSDRGSESKNGYSACWALPVRVGFARNGMVLHRRRSGKMSEWLSAGDFGFVRQYRGSSPDLPEKK